MTTQIDRRRFIASATLSAPAIVAASQAAPSNRVRLGFIGCGARGSAHMRILSRFPDVEIAAVSDVIEPRMDQARRVLAKAPYPQKPEAVLDYRRMLDRKDLDAVFIATTQHWHGLPFIDACQARKHIYVEKPLSHTVVEGRTMANAARKYGIIALMGTQQHIGEHYQKAMEIVRSGKLGKIGLVECWNYADRGERAGRLKDSDPPPGYHWDQWLGPAPAVPFNQGRVRDHNWFFDYGGGVLMNWGPHHLDIALWAMNNATPLTAVATGGKFVEDDIADTPDVLETSWEFPGFLLTCRQRSYNNFHHLQSRPYHHGICFYGKQATLVIDRFGYEIYSNIGSKPYQLYAFPLEPPVEKVAAIPDSAPGGQDGPYQRMFLDSIKEGKKPLVDLEFSRRVSVCCQLGNIAYLTRRRIKWDAEKETIRGDEEAARLLARPRRKGYELPKV